MKLVHPDLEGQILLDFNKPCEWIIESPDIFLKVLQELCSQINGSEGSFVLSDEKEISLSKYSEIIVNPLNVNINERKILNKLYTELLKLSIEENIYLETLKIKTELQEYFMKLEHTSNYFLKIDSETDMMAIFKALGIKFQNYADNLIEYLCQYITIITSLMNKKLIILVNLRSYINDEQLKLLVENLRYKEITLLFIENMERKLLNGFYRYIIDSDQCEIY